MPWPKGRPLPPDHLQRTRRKSKPPVPLPPNVREWAWFLWLALRKRSPGHQVPANVGQRTIEEFARRLSLIGSPSDPGAQQVFYATVALLFARGRLDPRKNKKQTLAKYLELYPDNREGLMRLLDSVKATATIPGPGIAKAGLSVENFLKVAAQIPEGSAQGFVQWILNDRHRRERTITAIFCPATFDHWKVLLRGLVGDLADPSYKEQVRRKVRTIT